MVVSYEKNNSLLVKFPEIAKEWNYDKNGNLTPDLFSHSSNQPLWWKCVKGHEWIATISDRTRTSKNGCPFCSNKRVLKGYNDFKTVYPQIASEWDYEKNDLVPDEVLYGSTKKVWWRCKKGHVSPTVTCNKPGKFKFGSVGTPLDCCEIKIAHPDDKGVGEIYVKGTNVMVGYYGDPEATAEAFDGEWFKTGDYGRIDKDGFLFMVGRKKNLICLSNGKNVSPEELEDKLRTIDYVEEVLVYADDNIIVGEFYLKEDEYPDARARLKNDIAEFNRKMPSFKNINKIVIRDEPFPKTTTLKIVRKYN